MRAVAQSVQPGSGVMPAAPPSARQVLSSYGVRALLPFLLPPLLFLVLVLVSPTATWPSIEFVAVLSAAVQAVDSFRAWADGVFLSHVVMVAGSVALASASHLACVDGLRALQKGIDSPWTEADREAMLQAAAALEARSAKVEWLHFGFMAVTFLWAVAPGAAVWSSWHAPLNASFFLVWASFMCASSCIPVRLTWPASWMQSYCKESLPLMSRMHCLPLLLRAYSKHRLAPIDKRAFTHV